MNMNCMSVGMETNTIYTWEWVCGWIWSVLVSGYVDEYDLYVRGYLDEFNLYTSVGMWINMTCTCQWVCWWIWPVCEWVWGWMQHNTCEWECVWIQSALVSGYVDKYNLSLSVGICMNTTCTFQWVCGWIWPVCQWVFGWIKLVLVSGNVDEYDL